MDAAGALRAFVRFNVSLGHTATISCRREGRKAGDHLLDALVDAAMKLQYRGTETPTVGDEPLAQRRIDSPSKAARLQRSFHTNWFYYPPSAAKPP